MSYPNLINANSAVTTRTTSLIPSDYTEEQDFTLIPAAGWYEVNAAGDETTNPLGQSGPFLLEVDAEKILCSSITAEGAVIVQADETAGTNGRGYSSTTVVAHSPGALVTLLATSAQDAPGGVVDSVFGRSGTVAAGNADYLAVAHGGLTGAVAPTRFVGGTASGHPTTGTFAVGDFVIDATGVCWICTVAGTPGTWVNAAGSNAAASGSVVGADAFGASPTAGAAATFSKGDHDHGLPADPTTDLRATTGATTLIYPEQHATSGAPAYVKGALYFDTTLNKLRVGGATAWETVTSV